MGHEISYGVVVREIVAIEIVANVYILHRYPAAILPVISCDKT